MKSSREWMRFSCVSEWDLAELVDEIYPSRARYLPLAVCGWDLAESGWNLAECVWDLAELVDEIYPSRGWDLDVCGWDLAESGWNLAEREWDLAVCGWDLAVCGWDLAACGWDLDKLMDEICPSRGWDLTVPRVRWDLVKLVDEITSLHITMFLFCF